MLVHHSLSELCPVPITFSLALLVWKLYYVHNVQRHTEINNFILKILVESEISYNSSEINIGNVFIHSQRNKKSLCFRNTRGFF